MPPPGVKASELTARGPLELGDFQLHGVPHARGDHHPAPALVMLLFADHPVGRRHVGLLAD